ncbi:sulfhydryl oxidase 1-like isoform X2 [Acanthaster planci]|uniref:Sulfhydryl oxidase 1-like isoform X2 n=1 Tax=Acanthaster planci TaxID=133434 RepID=A0A8B7ZWU3_ACAPL|nr:sulfhydryl oxidase 1-like isoform X2 [Acanthaster planci]
MGILALGHVGRRTFVFWKYSWIAFFIFNSDILRCYSVNIPRKPVDSLYDVSDIGKLGLSIFDNTTLKEAIYSSDQAWFVQFYSSWCGHCVNFAPTWKIFANDVKGWWRVARIAVLNCADPYNTKICSEYVDVGFPSLRLFKAFQQNGTGDLCKAPRDVSHLRQALIDHISKHSPQNTPSNWPMLSPVKVKWLLNFFWRNPRTKMKFIAVVFEDSESYTGRELILDMSNLKNILVVRVLQQELSRNPLPSEWKVGELPSLFILRQNGKPSKLWRMGNRESFFKALQAYIKQTLPASGTKETLNGQEQERNVMNGPDDNLRKTPHHEVDKNIEQFVNHTSRRAVARLVVYMEDLESTLIYSLRYEVALQKLIKADAMSALQAYIAVLNKYFPGRPCVMSTLNKLQKLLQPHVYLSNDGWSSILNQLHNFQNPDCFFKNDVTWVGCKGSAAIYRGYPCGLWVLFHTLTVSHASQDSYLSSQNTNVLTFLLDDWTNQSWW